MTLRAILWCAVSTQAQAVDEKDSLPTQEADQLAIAEKNNWIVVDTLRVPGHSRRYIDIHEAARDMRAAGIDALDRLIEHFDRRDFDILICRDADRFARTQTLHSFIVEKTVSIGAKIYSLADGMIDQNNYRMFISMSGYSAAAQVDKLVQGRKIGMLARARRGLPAGEPPISHKVVRDERGKAVTTALDETLSRMWLDLAELLFDGVPYLRLERQLYQRYGHVNPKTGKPYTAGTLRKMLFNPMFWGNCGLNYRKHGQVWGTGAWAFDPAVPAPDGAQIFYDVCPPVYKGNLAERVKAEINRRSNLMTGSLKRERPLAGLLMCAGCGYALNHAGGVKKRSYYRCISNYEIYDRNECPEKHWIPTDVALEYITDRLRESIELNDPDMLTADRDTTTEQNRLQAINSEINTMTLKLGNLISNQALAPTNVQDIFFEQIQTASNSLAHLRNEKARIEQQLSALDTTIRRAAFQDLLDITLDDLWEKDDRTINQLLHRLMGRYRFVVSGGRITGIALSVFSSP